MPNVVVNLLSLTSIDHEVHQWLKEQYKRLRIFSSISIFHFYSCIFIEENDLYIMFDYLPPWLIEADWRIYASVI